MTFGIDETAPETPIAEGGNFDMGEHAAAVDAFVNEGGSPAPFFGVETPTAPVTESDAPAAVMTETRQCVICHEPFNPASAEKCQSRPEFDSKCCPHEDCHAMNAFA